MKELSDILAALRDLTEPAVLVTVVAVEGSTYRRPGARMLISPSLRGGRIGSISGGCLEDEACRRALFLTDKGPSVVTYETGLDDGPGPGYTLGCGGRVTAMFERIGPGLNPLYLRFADDHRRQGRATLMATVIAIEGEPGLRIGDRPFLWAEGDDPLVEPVAGHIVPEAAAALEASQSRLTTLDLPDGRAQVLLEVIPAPVHLFIFGTGHDAEPVAMFASRLGWRITIVGAKTTEAVQARLSAYGEFAMLDHAPRVVSAPLPRRSAAIVMNHNYAHDSRALTVLLGSRIAYIGILGPRHRTDAMLADVASDRSDERPGAAAMADLSRVHAPIGLDIGAETPEEVALAIVSEVQAFFGERDGGRLRDRSGAIHRPVSGTVNAPGVDASCPLDSAP